MAVITGYQFEGSTQLAEFDMYGDTRLWTPNVGDAAAVIRHLYQDSSGVVRIEHDEGGGACGGHRRARARGRVAAVAQVVGGREARLPGADHDDIDGLRSHTACNRAPGDPVPGLDV